MAADPLLSIVVPVKDEAENVRPLCDEVAAALGAQRYEIVFVDDGSRDETWDRIRVLHEEDPRVCGVRFRANAGKSAAYMAGFRAAKGSLVATMDGDLQDDPKDLLVLLDAVQRGTDLAIGWKTTGKSSKTTFVLSRLANGLVRRLTRSAFHDINCPLRVMRAAVAHALDLRADHHRYIPLIAQSRGFSVSEHPVANRPRQHGHSKYGGSKYVSSATALIGMTLYLRFGQRPMALFGSLGGLSLLIGILICAWVVLDFAVYRANIDDDIPTLILGAMFVLTGTQLLALGLLGEILVRRLRAQDETGGGDVVETVG